MKSYSHIDSILNDWGDAHAITWLSEYQDTQVRTFFLGSASSRSRVQVWVEPPAENIVVVHLFRGGARSSRKDARLTTTISDLSRTLSEALEIATSWTKSHQE